MGIRCAPSWFRPPCSPGKCQEHVKTCDLPCTVVGGGIFGSGQTLRPGVGSICNIVFRDTNFRHVRGPHEVFGGGL